MTQKSTPPRLKNAREIMPQTAAWLDELRAVFGADDINAAIKAGMAGQATFWASENGHTLGVKATDDGVPITPPYKPASAPGIQPQGAGRGGRKSS